MKKTGRVEEGVDKHFATSNETEENSISPDVSLKRKRVVSSPFGLYAILLAISYMLCVQYCDKNESLYISSFFLKAHARMYMCTCERQAHIFLDESSVFNRTLEASRIYIKIASFVSDKVIEFCEA